MVFVLTFKLYFCSCYHHLHFPLLIFPQIKIHFYFRNNFEILIFQNYHRFFSNCFRVFYFQNLGSLHGLCFHLSKFDSIMCFFIIFVFRDDLLRKNSWNLLRLSSFYFWRFLHDLVLGYLLLLNFITVANFELNILCFFLRDVFL